MSGPPIGRLVDDVLHQIFGLVLRNGNEQWLSRWITVGALVSSVSSRWRSIARSDASLWRDIFIGPWSSPAMMRLVLNRAAKHNLRVLFCVPKDMGGPLFKGFSAPFNASIQLVVAQSPRWDTLSVISPFQPLLCLAKILADIPFPNLCSLELVRTCDTAATLCCGPFTMLDPATFRCLSLDGVVIRPTHSTQFSGLQSLSIANTDLRMLDGLRMQLLTSASPTFPTECTPTMTGIQYLSMSTPLLSYTPWILSFNPSTLVSLKLSGFSADNFPTYNTSESEEPLVPKLLTGNLRFLELANIDSVGIDRLISSLRASGKRWGGLRTLTVASVDLRGDYELEIHNIFPNLTDLLHV